jgi:hypothetical protein
MLNVANTIMYTRREGAYSIEKETSREERKREREKEEEKKICKLQIKN